MVFSSDPLVGSAIQATYLDQALTAARRAIPLEANDAWRDKITGATAVLAEAEQRARQAYAEHCLTAARKAA